jgi:HAD superfamily hydrolase (TIGR01509 family)
MGVFTMPKPLENRQNRKALVFDYDGVLADTEAFHWKSWNQLLAEYQIELNWEEYCRLGKGVSDAQMCESLQRMGLLSTYDQLMQENRKRNLLVLEWSLAQLPIPQETIDLLTKPSAYSLGLVTSSDRCDVEPVLRAAGIYERFDAMVFGDDVKAHKPAPDPYLRLAEKLGVTTGTAFEDSQPGLESARAAGFKVVQVDNPRDLARLVVESLRSW